MKEYNLKANLMAAKIIDIEGLEMEVEASDGIVTHISVTHQWISMNEPKPGDYYLSNAGGAGGSCMKPNDFKSMYAEAVHDDVVLSTDDLIEMPVDANQLSGSEAVFGFCAWLTTREEPTIMSSHDDAGVVADLAGQFCDKNNLDDPRDEWEENLSHPIDQVNPSDDVAAENTDQVDVTEAEADDGTDESTTEDNGIVDSE